MTPFKKAHDKYVRSERFNKASDPTTLKSPADQRQYLENRLHRAFSAGWSAALDSAEKELTPGQKNRTDP